jgi:hypothetical protein
VFLSVVKNCTKQELIPVLRGNILGESDVYTDGWAAYDGLVIDGYKLFITRTNLRAAKTTSTASKIFEFCQTTPLAAQRYSL